MVLLQMSKPSYTFRDRGVRLTEMQAETLDRHLVEGQVLSEVSRGLEPRWFHEAGIFGSLDEATVEWACATFCVRLRPQHELLANAEHVAAVRRMAREGKTQTEIGARLRISNRDVSQILSDNRISFRRQERRAFTEEMRARAVELARGLSKVDSKVCTDIAHQVGTNPNYVREALIEAGLMVRA